MTTTVSTKKAIYKSNLVSKLDLEGVFSAAEFSTPLVEIFNTGADLDYAQNMTKTTMKGFIENVDAFLMKNYKEISTKTLALLQEKYVLNARNISKEDLSVAYALIKLDFVLANFHLGDSEELFKITLDLFKHQVLAAFPKALQYVENSKYLRSKYKYSYAKEIVSLEI